jgi:hypothetical protein
MIYYRGILPFWWSFHYAGKDRKMNDLNFSHRVSGIHDNHLDICDSLTAMTNRALGVLQLIALQFDDGGASRLNDELIANALDSVISEITDIRAYSLAIGKSAQGMKND